MRTSSSRLKRNDTLALPSFALMDTIHKMAGLAPSLLASPLTLCCCGLATRGLCEWVQGKVVVDDRLLPRPSIRPTRLVIFPASGVSLLTTDKKGTIKQKYQTGAQLIPRQAKLQSFDAGDCSR